ncbi:MAG: S8 family serine peptidase, partial [Dehalococcoidia bacterium]
MKTYIRFIGAVLLAVLVVASLGATPAQAQIVAGVERELTAFDPAHLGASRYSENHGYLDWPGPDSAYLSPVTIGPSGPIEVIIGLDGRSLAAEQSYRRQMGLAVLDGEAQKAYVASLEQSQSDLKPVLEAAGARILYEYQIVFNGLAVLVDRTKLVEITSLPGVRGAHLAQTVSLALDNSVPFIFGGKTNAELGVDGSGVTIAVIDTGIDYTHAGLGGSGVPADYAANDPTIIEAGTFPTAKVIGGTDLVGEFYDAGCPPADEGIKCSRIPDPDPDPLDLHGHGSHVSGIAAGIGTSFVSPGVAPEASLLAVKVFALGSTSTAVIVAALEFAADPNQDGDVSDAVDVINMSLGSPYGRDTSPDTVASNAAVDLGIIVVASAGNDGDLPYSTGSPAAASKAISVAASNDPGVGIQFLKVSGTVDGVADRDDYVAVEAAFTPPLSGVGLKEGLTEFVGEACDVGGPGGPNPFPPGELTGKIPLIVRGACRFDEKILNVEEAGAIAAVIYNNRLGAGPIVMGGDPIVEIPGFMIGNPDGVAIQAALGPQTTFTLDPENFLPLPNRLAEFTSSGPRFVDSALKPDISAPGVSIASVLVGSGTDSL